MFPSHDQLEDRLFLAGNRLKQELECEVFGSSVTPADVEFDSDSAGNEFDNGNNFDIGTYSYTVPDTGHYAFQSRLFYGIRLVPDTTATVTPKSNALQIRYSILVNGNIVQSSVAGVQLNNVPAFTTSYESANTIAQPDPNSIFNNNQSADYSNLAIINLSNQLYQAGDVIKIQFTQGTYNFNQTSNNTGS